MFVVLFTVVFFFHCKSHPKQTQQPGHQPTKLMIKVNDSKQDTAEV